MAEPPAIGGSDVAERREAVEVLEGGDGKISPLAVGGPKDRDALLLFSMNASSAVEDGTNIPLTEKDKFAIACSRKLMRSWVSQPSPCCAAASVGKQTIYCEFIICST